MTVVVMAVSLTMAPLLPAASQDVIPAEGYIVVLEPATTHVAQLAGSHARMVRGQTTHVYRHALKGYAITVSPAGAARLQGMEGVVGVVPDTPFKGHPGTTVTTAPPGDCVSPSATEQCLPAGVNRVGADQSSTRAGNGAGAVDVDIAVLDTGVDDSHPDLNVAGGVNCTRERSPSDLDGHGTHVAGIAAARDNGLGVVGVSPGARIWNVKVLDKHGSGTVSSIVCGVDWVTEHASTVEVANMSLAAPLPKADDGNCGLTRRNLLHQAICTSVEAGVTYAVAAGNSSNDASSEFPASFDEVITVSALADFDGVPGGLSTSDCDGEVDDAFTSFSNFGVDVDVIAPGACVWSTFSREVRLRRGQEARDYAAFSGTSMATPHAAGAAALYLSQHPRATPAEVRAALRSEGVFDWDTATDPDGIADPLVSTVNF